MRSYVQRRRDEVAEDHEDSEVETDKLEAVEEDSDEEAEVDEEVVAVDVRIEFVFSIINLVFPTNQCNPQYRKLSFPTLGNGRPSLSPIWNGLRTEFIIEAFKCQQKIFFADFH